MSNLHLKKLIAAPFINGSFWWKLHWLHWLYFILFVHFTVRSIKIDPLNINEWNFWIHIKRHQMSDISGCYWNYQITSNLWHIDKTSLFSTKDIFIYSIRLWNHTSMKMLKVSGVVFMKSSCWHSFVSLVTVSIFEMRNIYSKVKLFT